MPDSDQDWPISTALLVQLESFGIVAGVIDPGHGNVCYPGFRFFLGGFGFHFDLAHVGGANVPYSQKPRWPAHGSNGSG